MPTAVRLGLAAAAALLAASPVAAQTYGSQGYTQQGYGSTPSRSQDYPPSVYDSGASSGYQPSGADRQGYGQPGYGSAPSQDYPPSTYDRGASPGYPSSGYDRQGGYGSDRRAGDAGGAERYGQPDRYDGGQGGPPAQDPEELARRLNLTGSQRAAYDSYRRAFQPDEARMRQEEDEMRRMASLTTPQRLDMARASQARDRADFDRTDSATRAFYAQLSPAQRRTFDQLTAPQMDEDGPEGGGPSPTQPAARPPR